jgi:type II secretory pathway component GspD/PulD (secretin)
LDRHLEVNGHDFHIPREKVERKTAKHGVELKVKPEVGKDGKVKLDKKPNKPMAKNSRENYNLFADRLEEFMKTHDGVW